MNNGWNETWLSAQGSSPASDPSATEALDTQHLGRQLALCSPLTETLWRRQEYR